jgi:hypothetical protein
MRLKTDADLQAGWSFTERRTEQKFDGQGRVKSEKVMERPGCRQR